MGLGYIRPGLVSVSDALVLGVLTLAYRIPDLSRKLTEVNPVNSDAEYGVLLHHEIGRTARSVSGGRGKKVGFPVGTVPVKMDW